MNLLLLFSYGTHLKDWVLQGLVDRELAYLDYLSEEGFEHIYLYTYGNNENNYIDKNSRFTVLDTTLVIENSIQDVIQNRLRKYRDLYALFSVWLNWEVFKKSDVIRTNQSSGAWVGVLIKIFFPKKPLIIRCGWVNTEEMMKRENNLFGFGLFLAKLKEYIVFHLATRIIVTTQKDKNYIVNQYNISEALVAVIPNSVDLKQFFPIIKSSEIIDHYKILVIGRLVEMKNIQSLMLAMDTISTKISLEIIGDGEYRVELEKLSKQVSFPVKFIGNIPNNKLPEKLQNANLFVMPQLYGSGMSKVILEAMACGTLVLASDIPPHRIVIRNGENGFLCNTNIEDISKALESIFSLPPEEARRIRTQAVLDIQNNYSMQANAKKEFQLIRSIMK